MTTTPNDVVGQAVYIEATRMSGLTKYVTQILLTPEVEFSPSSTVHMAMYRRRLSTVETRKTWRHFSSATNSKRSLGTKGALVASLIDESVSDDMLAFVRPTLNALVESTNRYEIVKVPIVVDVIRSDMDDIRLGKTPYKVFGRVWKSRKKLGFPENFL